MHLRWKLAVPDPQEEALCAWLEGAGSTAFYREADPPRVCYAYFPPEQAPPEAPGLAAFPGVRLLEAEESPDLLKPNAATQLAGILLDSDIIHIVAGTKINEALQDPSLPEDLDIRRNILRGLKKVLTEKFLKEVRIRFV